MGARKTQQEYISQVTNVHNGYYDYDNVLYKNNNTSITITCPVHGYFSIIPYTHLKGAGCKKCYLDKKLEFIRVEGLKRIINEGSIIHNNKYNYEKSIYINSETSVIIICPIHGEFKQTPYNHINKKCGCPICGGIKGIINRPKERTKFWGYTREDILKCIEDNNITEMCDLKENYGGYYSAAQRRLKMMGELDKLLTKRNRKHTFEDCKHKASLFQHIKYFKETYPKEYSASFNNGWLNEITQHMTPLPTKFKRCVYEITFDDGTIYLGLTCNYDSRMKEHLGTSRKGTSVTRYMKEKKQSFTHKMLTDYINDYEAAQLEAKLIIEYKDRGYKLLNTQKGGNLGSLPRNDFSIEYCKSISSKYTTRASGPNSFKSKENKIYRYCQKQGWLDEVCSHMKPTSEIRTIWNEEKLIDFIKENNITVRSGKHGLREFNQTAYRFAIKLNLLNKLFPNKRKN
jgi:predicted GIY-YIG superfamily endonuclease